MDYIFNETPVFGSIEAYRDNPLELHKVDETKWEKMWDSLVDEHHYLGFRGSMGCRIKYFATIGYRIVGAISFSSATYRLASRDKYIGWDNETREMLLPHVINNNRFLIFPWIHVKNMASKLLSMSLKQVIVDWTKQYEITPYMVETFVDTEIYQGTCYKASNWTYLGLTKGYGTEKRNLVHHGRKKSLYVFILDKHFKSRFKPDITRVSEREELIAMMNGTPIWHPTLLKELGLTNNPGQKITELFAEHLMLFTPFIGREENKLHFRVMIQGLLSELKRKSIEPIALAYEGTDGVRNLTNFMSRSKLKDDKMLEAYRQNIAEVLSHPEGMITGDETSFPKKGNESVGVARQYCGNTGKTDNCQSGVMVGYAGTKGYGLIDHELYLPEKWFDDSFAEKRKKCGIPENIEKDGFKTKNTMLLSMIQKSIISGQFPAKYVGVDSAFGSDTAFLDGLPEDVIYFADVRSNQLVFPGRPNFAVPEYSGKGKRPTKARPSIAPQMVKDIIENTGEWESVVLGIGAKGAVFAEDKCIRVVEVRDELPGKDIWLYARKLKDGKIKYSLCNAPSNSSKNDVRKPALMRWSIEQCFKECKDYLGMDHYESRSWLSWHRHILLTMIAHLFIVKARIHFSMKPQKPGKTPFVTSPVSLDEYLDSHMKLLSGANIAHPDIHELPPTAQQFLTIGLVKMLIDGLFPKAGHIIETLDYYLQSAASAFDSHSLSGVNRVIAAQA